MNSSEEWRRECEAREHLRRTNGDPLRVKALLDRVKAKRGEAAAETLRQDMRTEYRRVQSGADTTQAE